MSEQPEKEGRLGNWIGLAILAVAYFASIWHLAWADREESVTDTVVLRLTHWQLEAGVREGLDEMIRRFEKRYYADTGTRVRIVQNPISERVYRQYVQTQCIGDTAPDLIEIGLFDTGSYLRRYFLANTADAKSPNPYNAGTPLAGLPWAETYIDGMYGSLDPETFEYFGAGLTTASVRLFYNQRLFREVLGSEASPRDFREFLQTLTAFQEWAKKNGKRDFIPIAATKYQLNLFQERFLVATQLDFLLKNDRNFDGAFGWGPEVAFSWAEGRYDFTDPALKAGHEMLNEVTRYFPTGFMAQDRMEAGFRFTQQKAAYITSGSWDALSFIMESDFPVGVIDIPLPTKTDPVYGPYVCGRLSETAIWSGLRFGITRLSRHPDIALKFLQFCTTSQNNEDFNRICKWLPLIRGAKPHPVMAPFMPSPDGYWRGAPYQAGQRSTMVYEQMLWEFVEHKITYDEMARRLDREMPRAMAWDLERYLEGCQISAQNQDVSVSWNLARCLFGNDREDNLPKLRAAWENRVGPYEGPWLLEWQRIIADPRHPRARAIEAFMSTPELKRTPPAAPAKR